MADWSKRLKRGEDLTAKSFPSVAGTSEASECRIAADDRDMAAAATYPPLV